MYINRLTLLKDVVFHVYISLYTRYFVLTFQMFAIYVGEENDFLYPLYISPDLVCIKFIFVPIDLRSMRFCISH